MASSGGVGFGAPSTGVGSTGGAGLAPPKTALPNPRAASRNPAPVRVTNTPAIPAPKVPGAKAPGAKAPAGKGGKPAGKGPAPTVDVNNALLNPNAPLQGQALAQAAGAIADAQTKGPISELAAQIARNQQQTGAAEKNTAGYFNQLGQFVNQSNQQLGGISAGLNQTLAGIGNDAQARIGQAFTPSQSLQNLASQGLGQGAMDRLTADRASAETQGALGAQAFRSAGALQGANAQTLGAQDLGAYATRGQETLGRIAQAGQLENAGLNSKIGSLQADRGALYTKALGSLREQELHNEAVKSQFNLNEQRVQATAQNNAANQALKAAAIRTTLRGQDLANMRSDRTYQLDLQKFGASQAKDNYLRTHGLGPYKPAGAGRGRGLTPAQQEKINSQRTLQVKGTASTINTLKSMGLSDSQVRDVLTTGYLKAKDASGKAVTYRFERAPGGGSGPIANAAFDLWVYHYLSPSDVQGLKQIGFDPNGTFPTSAPKGQAARNARNNANSVGNAFGSFI